MAPPALKPPARARRVRALVEGRRVALSAYAIAELFRGAETLTEGGLDGEGRWYGSIMITFDLAQLRRRSRDLDDDGAMAALVRLVEGSVRVRVRAHRLACAEIYRRFPDRAVGTAQLESRFVREGDRLLLDIDLEAPIDLPSTGAAHRRAASGFDAVGARGGTEMRRTSTRAKRARSRSGAPGKETERGT